jgi:hypothetical protein
MRSNGASGTARTGGDADSVAIDLSAGVGQSLAQLLKRPEITVEQVVPVLRELAPQFFERAAAIDDAANSAGTLSSEIRI